MKEYLHGGDLDIALKKYGGHLNDWLDLSTGINRISYPWKFKNDILLQNLPRKKTIENLSLAASKTLRMDKGNLTLSVAGAQSAIQFLPLLFKHKDSVKILSPTYNEYENCFRNFGFNIEKVYNFSDLNAAQIAVIVNPNNPTGKLYTDQELETLSENVEFLIIDQSFHSISSRKIQRLKKNMIRINSFGKFFGLAGIRLGFVSGPAKLIKSLEKLVGPWQVSNLALNIGMQALTDNKWILTTEKTLMQSSQKLKDLFASVNWNLIGNTFLFHTYSTENAKKVEEHFAMEKIWVRTFDYSDKWVRIGIPGKQEEWERLKIVIEKL